MKKADAFLAARSKELPKWVRSAIKLTKQLTMVTAALFCAAVTPPPTAQPVNLDMPPIHFQAWLVRNFENEPMIVAHFTSDDSGGHSVYCLSALRDVKYVLRDSKGNVVLGKADPWKYATDQVTGGGGTIGPTLGMKDPCKTIHAAMDERRVLLYELYPELPSGKYSLEMTLAPHDSGERSVSAALPVVVDNTLPTWSLTTAAGDDAAVRTMTLPHLRLEIGLGHNAEGDAVLFVGFYTDDPVHHSVYCRSAATDVRYDLTDQHGNRIAMAQPWLPGTEVATDSGTGNVSGRTDPCETVKSAKNERKIRLEGMYPKLPHGTYVLRVTLAPERQADSAASAPFSVRM